jgi:general secretion pathway protein M
LTGLLRHKKALYIFSGLVCFAVVLALGVNLLLSERRESKQLKDQREEMMLLKAEFLSLRQRLNLVEGRENLSNIQGIVQAVDEVFSSIGLREKVKTVKSAGKRETRGGFEEEADVSIEKVSMNEMVNILYRIERAPMVLIVKKATVKKSFENPELLNLTLDLSFLKAK